MSRATFDTACWHVASADIATSQFTSGMIIGLSTFTTKHHIVRATLEATCFQTRAILDAMSKDVATSSPRLEDDKQLNQGPAGLKVLQVDGGMTGSDVTMQIQADILGIDVRRPEMRE